MSGFQQTIIIGNVGKEPDMRYTPNNIAVCSFTVAVTEKWTDSNTKEKKEATTWYRVTCWRKLAELANQLVRKGERIQVVGKVEARGYKDSAGEPKASLELTADSFLLLGNKPQGDGEHGNANYDDYAPPPNNTSEIPF
ncbi:MAG: single-stranded DNA-binding protein [bacterium]|nr:single-stranded DNA-binding protein [bacterium]